MAAPATQDRHIEAARRRVAHLHALDHATTAAERRILDAAEKRLAVVEAEITQARRRALVHDGAADRYMELTEERGRLLEVIRRAGEHIGQPA